MVIKQQHINERCIECNENFTSNNERTQSGLCTKCLEEMRKLARKRDVLKNRLERKEEKYKKHKRILNSLKQKVEEEERIVKVIGDQVWKLVEENDMEGNIDVEKELEGIDL